MPKRAIITGALACILAGGCLPPPGQSSGGAGRPLENQYQDELIFSDIPIPRYFVYDPHKSFKKVFLDKGNVRIASLTYRGSAHVRDVVKFYDEYMVAQGFGWKKIREELMRETGASLLVFNKAPSADLVAEVCKITVRRERGQTVLTIEVE